MILSFINIRKVPREVLKTSGFSLGFQHLPQDLANVNKWKIMFDPILKPLVFIFNAQYLYCSLVITFCLISFLGKKARMMVLY